jgi:hypothetical protein
LLFGDKRFLLAVSRFSRRAIPVVKTMTWLLSGRDFVPKITAVEQRDNSAGNSSFAAGRTAWSSTLFSKGIDDEKEAADAGSGPYAMVGLFVAMLNQGEG